MMFIKNYYKCIGNNGKSKRYGVEANIAGGITSSFR